MFRFVTLTLLVLSVSLLFGIPAAQSAGSRINKDAQALARLMSPSAPAKNFRQDTANALGKRMISVIEVMEKSYRGSGPTHESLLAKALSFRDDLGRYEGMMLSNAILAAWREANAAHVAGSRTPRRGIRRRPGSARRRWPRRCPGCPA